jgi:hypothetical protein
MIIRNGSAIERLLILKNKMFYADLKLLLPKSQSRQSHQSNKSKAIATKLKHLLNKSSAQKMTPMHHYRQEKARFDEIKAKIEQS